ncbi:MAG: alpha/beta fold hydrolase [Chloroflexi bacterium]|nr:alpha/beta fold hydrolase [Chloroflexota bacterium]
MRPFRDRDDAGIQLAQILRQRAYKDAVVLGIPRGGVVPAMHVAEALGADLGVVVARKLRAPYQRELAIGAITADGVAWVSEELAEATGASGAYLEKEKAEQAAEAARREAAFDSGRRPRVAGRPVIVVDDGVATGATMIAAVRSLKSAGASPLVVAVPVGPPRTLDQLRAIADEVVAIEEVEDFYAIGQFYVDFEQVEDEEVRRVLDQYQRRVGQGTRVTWPVRIARASGALAARVITPADAGPRPVVVFVHGLSSSKDSPRNVVIAERLVDAGIAAVLFDLSGHGESTAEGSTVEDFASDLCAVVAWMEEQPQFDTKRVGLAGSSLGGLAVAAAVRCGSVRPRAIVLRAPPADAQSLKGLGEETLLIAGDADPLLAGLRGAVDTVPGVTLATVAGASHLFEEPGALERAADLTVTWFERHLGGAATGPAHTHPPDKEV